MTKFVPPEYDLKFIKGSFQHKEKETGWFDNDLAVAYMLIEGDLMIFGGKYEDFEEESGTLSKTPTCLVFCNCSDVFAWGCCDDEPVALEEVEELFLMWHEDKAWGSTKWVCKKRNMQPQQPIVKDMKEQGKWCEMMESLPKNTFD